VDEEPGRPVSTLEKEQADINRERSEATLRLILLIVVLVVATGGSILLLVYFLRTRNKSVREYLLRNEQVEQIPTRAAPITMMATSSSFPSSVARLTNNAWLKSVESVPATKTRDHLPYFQVRATHAGQDRRMARIYVLEKELVVIDIGPCFDGLPVTGPARTPGDIIADAIAANEADNNIEFNLQKFDQLNRKGLLDLATKDGNIRAPFVELTDLSIDVVDTGTDWRDGDASTSREGRGSAWPDGSASTWSEGRGSAWPDGSGSTWSEGRGSAWCDGSGSKWRASARTNWSQSARSVGTFRFRRIKGGAFTFEFMSWIVFHDAIELLRFAIARGLPVPSGLEEVTIKYAEDA
jgi:hypothetical protein